MFDLPVAGAASVLGRDGMRGGAAHLRYPYGIAALSHLGRGQAIKAGVAQLLDQIGPPGYQRFESE